ncbi:MAG: phosphatidate cytidylyltransferase [Gammaproteobacteria bacterium]|nr:phosphatidate cytidylyltransferase [Gammaproteobacteria bacterium]MDH3578314.1 phosphatidate cytidylyltransferase [Gammaproteobacteria bacterium]
MLRTRIITAVIALAVLGVVLFVIPSQLAELFIAVVVLAGAWEWSGFLGVSGSMSRSAYTLVIGTLMVATYMLLPVVSVPVLQIAFLWWFGAFVWTLFYPTSIPPIIRMIVGALVLVPMFLALILLYRMGPLVLLLALLIVWAADAGAYFAGKQFGRVKLAPSISPGKTWEGVLGGLVAVALLALAVAQWSDASLAVLLPFCLAVAALSIVGDLTVSMFKRTAGVKDSGSLFPGHGGVLDRVDSVAAAAPLFALGLRWLELV